MITSRHVAIKQSSRVNGVFTATISASDCDCRDATFASPRSSRTSPPWYRAVRGIASPRTRGFWCAVSGRPPSAATSDSRCRRRSASAASCPSRTPAGSGKDRDAWSGRPSWGPIPAKRIDLVKFRKNCAISHLPRRNAYLVTASVVTGIETDVPVEKVAHAVQAGGALLQRSSWTTLARGYN